MSSDRSNYKLLVTGGSGFIGTSTISYYAEHGASILNLDIAAPMLSSQNKYWREVDILDQDAVDKAFDEFKPTHVLHLAARTDLDEEKDINGYTVNIEGVENVVNASKGCDSVERVSIVSTMFVCEPGHTPTSDTDYCPHTVYGQSKVMTEKITRDSGMECVWSIIRPAVIWGPYHERLRQGFFSILGRGLYFHPGNTRAIKSYGYIGNSVYQIDRIFESDKNDVDKQVFYMADEPINLLDWGGEFSRQLIGKKLRKMPYFLMKLIAYGGDIMVKLGYKSFPMTNFRLHNMTCDNVVPTESMHKIAANPPYTYQQGIKETVKWLNSVNQ
ncbi:MAG: NAD(P)-dependent oxidoreductase [Gammaproteobacteria bacterium]|nr:NAD(P)-dependent oxidoreductase [Gammaproteobacteria bacterium]